MKKRLIILLILTIIILLTAIFGEYITPYAPNEQNLQEALLSPCKNHLLGTDYYGRDIFSRVIVGTKFSIFSTILLILIITIIGTAVGILCGYIGGKIDNIIMRITDVFLAFPEMVFAIAIVGLLGGGILNSIIALSIISWPKYARLIRGQVLIIKKSDFIKAAKLSGTKTIGIIFRHIIPNIIELILVTAISDIGTMIMEMAGLSFLGLGAMPPTAEWGLMMNNGRSMIQTSPWVILAPGCAIFITVMIFNLLGDTIRDIVNVK